MTTTGPGAIPEMIEPGLARVLDHRVSLAQRAWRAPGVSAGIVRDGTLVWSRHVGSARLRRGAAPAVTAGDDTAFLIGSVTKTFTAVLVLALRDAGLVDLDASVGRYVPVKAHSDLTVRQLLSHSSGLQREPAGDLWVSLDGPDAERLLADLGAAEQVLPPAFSFHYSNLAFALLGQVIERVEGQPWEAVLRARILSPLGMTRTGLTPPPDRAIGYSVHPYGRTAAEEPTAELRATAPLGGLWSTVADLGRYAAFLADPDPAVLAPESLDEMCRPVVMTDLDSWSGAYGLGVGLQRRGDRVFVGHGGAMPGFLTGLMVRRTDRLGAVVLANTGTSATCVDLATELLGTVLDTSPSSPPVWVPERPVAELTEVLGLWWSEGAPIELFVEDGVLSAVQPQVGMASVTRFRPEGRDRFRAVEGRERGELLLVERDGMGALTRLRFATYAVTRDPLGFAELG